MAPALAPPQVFYHPGDVTGDVTGDGNSSGWRSTVVLGHGSLFNHGGDERTNVNYRPSSSVSDAFDFYAVRDVKAGEEPGLTPIPSRPHSIQCPSNAH